MANDKGLTLETSAFESLYGGQFTLSTQLIKPNYLVILPPTQHHSFFRNLSPLFILIVTLLAQMYRWLNGGHSGKDYNFLGNDKFPKLYERPLYERKLKSGYLERRIYERPLKSEPFIENQSEHICQNYQYINLL